MYRIQVQNNSFTYMQEGCGPLLILLHGYGGAPRNYKEMMGILKEHFTVVVPNFSSQYFSVDYNMRLGEIIHAFLHFSQAMVEKHGAAHVMAASFGAMIAQGACILDQSLFQSLTLLSPMPAGPVQFIRNPFLKMAVMIGKKPNVLASLLVTPAGKKAILEMEKLWQSQQELLRPKRKWKLRRIMILSRIIGRFNDICESEDWNFWRQSSQKMSLPIFLLWGTEDRIWKDNVYERIHYALKTSESLEVPGAGHMLMLDKPKWICTEFLDFIKRAPLSESA